MIEERLIADAHLFHHEVAGLIVADAIPNRCLYPLQVINRECRWFRLHKPVSFCHAFLQISRLAETALIHELHESRESARMRFVTFISSLLRRPTISRAAAPLPHSEHRLLRDRVSDL